MTSGDDLVSLAASLIDIDSVSGQEAELASYVEALLEPNACLEVVRIENNVVARTRTGRPARLLLGGHLDTVPPAGNERARLIDNELYGLGAADMKGGVAVMLALALEADGQAPVDLSFVFYACEEIAREHSGLHQIEREHPRLLDADVAVLLEPTGARVEAGCQGMVRAVVELGGVAAHSARPWTGVNAIHRLAPLLAHVASYAGREPIIDGCRYRESLQAVRVEGGGAGNVVPSRVRVTLSHRFAPDRDVQGAFSWLQEFLAPCLDAAFDDRVVLEESAPAAPPSLGQPLLGSLVALSDTAPVAKIAWTDVATFYERGVPAANFGPGDPELAHRADEHVGKEALARVYQILATLIGQGGLQQG